MKALLIDEARQRYFDALTEDDHSEFINGRVVEHAPTTHGHNVAVTDLVVLLDTHVQVRGLGYVGMNSCLVSLTKNDYQPDICYWRKEVSSQFSPDQMRFPVPDLIVEVTSPTTEQI